MLVDPMLLIGTDKPDSSWFLGLLCFLPILPAQLPPNLHRGDVPDSQGC